MLRRFLKDVRERIIGRLLDVPEQPERPYFSHPNIEITLRPHDSLAEVSPRHDREVLILRNAWYPDDVPKFVRLTAERMGKAGNNIYYLSNTEEIHRERLRWGLNSHFVNINCFIDEGVFKPAVVEEVKLYDAVAIGRFSRHKGEELKRHDLMSEVGALALLDPVYGTTDRQMKRKYCSRKNCRYFNRDRLSPQEVARILQLSRCGLILSAHEGACRASCEYLAAGLPVVSTPSVGGRDVWFDDYNSLIVDPEPGAVKEAVEYFKSHPRDPNLIRESFLKKAQTFRELFKNEVIAPILREYQVELQADDFLKEHPFFWWQEELRRREMGTADLALEFHDFGIGNVSPAVINYILKNVERGSSILEFGSGLSSRELSKGYNVTSIEHDPGFLDRYHEQYVYSELQERDLHYLEADCRKALKQGYEVVLVDGPPAYTQTNKKSRLGFQKYLGDLGEKTIVILDDVHRWWDCVNLLKTFIRLKREVVVIEEKSKFTAVLTREPPDARTLLRLAYLLYRAASYRYDGE